MSRHKGSKSTRQYTIEYLLEHPYTLLSPSEVADLLGINYYTVWRMIRNGELPALAASTHRKIFGLSVLRLLGLAVDEEVATLKNTK